MDRFHQMQVFVAVAEAEGFAAGARQLQLSAPAVTRAIAALEHDLGEDTIPNGNSQFFDIGNFAGLDLFVAPVLSGDGNKVLFDCGPVPYGQEGTGICEANTDGTGLSVPGVLNSTSSGRKFLPRDSSTPSDASPSSLHW